MPNRDVAEIPDGLLTLDDDSTTLTLVKVNASGVIDDDLGKVELCTDVIEAVEMLLKSDEVAMRVGLVELFDDDCVSDVKFVDTCLRISCRRCLSKLG